MSSKHLPIILQLSQEVISVGRVRPRYAWLANYLSDCEPGSVVTTCIVFYAGSCISLCLRLAVLSQKAYSPAWWDYVMLINLVLILVGSEFTAAIHSSLPCFANF